MESTKHNKIEGTKTERIGKVPNFAFHLSFALLFCLFSRLKWMFYFI